MDSDVTVSGTRVKHDVDAICDALRAGDSTFHLVPAAASDDERARLLRRLDETVAAVRARGVPVEVLRVCGDYQFGALDVDEVFILSNGALAEEEVTGGLG